MIASARPADARQEAPVSNILDVSVNSWPLNLVARFWRRDSGVCVLAEEYEGLGFILEESFVSAADGVPQVCLQDVPGLTWRLDSRAQTIEITAPFDRLKRQRLSVSPQIARIEAQADHGGFLAYDAFGEYSFDENYLYYQRYLSTSLQARYYTPDFTAETTGYAAISQDAQPSLIRLDSWIEFDNPDRVERLRIGDSYTTGLEWVQPVRFAGVHWGTNFEMRPDIVTTPVLVVREDLGAPSAIDLFVNGTHRFSDNAPPGAFELADLPTLTGANSIRVVITDPGGRQRETIVPLYAATRMLAPGLSEYNVFTGAARQNYGSQSNDYGDVFASANYRHGFRGFTLAGEVNAAGDYASASFGGSTTIANQFLVFGGASVSHTPQGAGLAWLASFERTGRNTNIAIRYERADNTYRDLGARLGYGRLVEMGLVTAGANLGWAGNINFAYAIQRNAFQARSEFVSMTYSVDFFDRQATLLVSGYAGMDGDDWGGTASLVFPLGRNVRGTASAHRDRDGAYNSLRADGDAYDQRLDWSVVAATGLYEGGFVQADWRGRHADLGGRAIYLNNSASVEARAAQSFIFMPEGMFVAGRIDDGFTLVKVDNFPDVEVFLENRPAGRTDRSGNLLVTGLSSYTGNALSIDPQDLPMDVQVERTTALVAPRLGAGLVTRFGVVKEISALVSLRLPDGASPPVGAVAAVTGSALAAPVGYDGDVYLRGLSPGPNRIEVTWPEGRCTSEIPGVAEAGRLRRIGVVTCAP